MTCVFLSHFIFFHRFTRFGVVFPIFSAQDRRLSCVVEAEETDFVRGIRSRLQGCKINTGKISGFHIGSSWQNQKLRIPWAALPPAVYWCTITNPRSRRSRISESFSFLLIGRGKTKASVGKLDTFGDYPVGSDCAIRVIVAQVLHSIVLMVQLKDKWRHRKWSSMRLAQMLHNKQNNGASTQCREISCVFWNFHLYWFSSHCVFLSSPVKRLPHVPSPMLCSDGLSYKSSRTTYYSSTRRNCL